MKLAPETHTAAQVIELLQLEPLAQEGGWFRRTGEAAGAQSAGRPGWSLMFGLFTPQQFSALHRLAADELWILHAGDALDMLLLTADGAGDSLVLGLEPAQGHHLQMVVPTGVWQGARVRAGGRWSLVSCIVVPGFRWEDFELGQRDALMAHYPAHAETIRELTRV